MKLLDYLACPMCKGDLQVIGEYLRCSSCHRDYHISDGIPDLRPQQDVLLDKRRWEKYLAAEENYQGQKRLKFEGFDGYFEYLFHISHEHFANKVCLEIGCGVTGAIHYLDNAKFTIGLDPLCLACKELYLAENTHLTPHIAGMGEYLPIKNSCIDAVFIYGVLDHCLLPASVLKETARVLKDRGQAYIYVNVFSKLPRYIRRGLSLIDIHPHHFSQKEIVGMVEGVGFKVDACYLEKMRFGRAWTVLKTGTLKSLVKHIGAAMVGMENLALTLVKA